jgi:hypothetical protein
MAHAQVSRGRTAQTPPRNRKARNELQILRQENKQLRETVAHLSKLVLTQIIGAEEPGEPPKNNRP